MKIQKRTANAIRKLGYEKIRIGLGLTNRQVVYSWFATLSVPDKHVPRLSVMLNRIIK